VYPGCGSSAAAFTVKETGDIACPVSQKGRSFFRERGKYQFPPVAPGNDASGSRIDDFGKEQILVHVHSGLGFALEGDARPDNLGKAVNVVGFHVVAGFDFLAHVFAPRLRAETALAERQSLQVDACLSRFLGHVQGVGWSTGKHGRSEVLHHHKLPARVAA